MGTPEATTAASGTLGDFTADAQESTWTRWPWAEPSRPWGHLGPAAPSGPVSPATAPHSFPSLCSVSPLSPCPALLSLCLHSVRPLPLLSPSRSPFPSAPRPLGASPPPHPRSARHGHRLAHALRADTKALGAGSAESCGQAGPVNTRAPDGRGFLSPDTTAWGPLHMDLGGRPAPGHGNSGGGGWRPSGPHGPADSPGGQTQPSGPYSLPCGPALRGGAGCGQGVLWA